MRGDRPDTPHHHANDADHAPGVAAEPGVVAEPIVVAKPAARAPELGRPQLAAPASVRVLVPETQGTGSATVTIVPEGELFIQYACVGDSSFIVLPTNVFVLGPDVRPRCSSSVADATAVGTALPVYPNELLKKGNLGKPLTLQFSTGPSTTWEIFIAESDPYYGTNLITNGGFEQPMVNDLTPPITSLPGWSLVGGVALTNGTPDGYPPLDRSQYLVLTGTVRTPGEVSQRVPTVPGDTYRLTFLEGAYSNCQGMPYVIDVYWSGIKVLGLTSTPVPPSKSSPEPSGDAWYTVADSSLVATTTTTMISFAGGAGCGAAFDDVILQQVPPTS